MAKISSLTLNQKLELIHEYEQCKLSKAAFAKNKGIPRMTFITILASKEKLESSLRVQDGRKRKKMRKSNFEEIEKALLKWFRYARTNNVPVSGLVLKEKALEVAKEFGVPDFAASSGWIERFKERHGLTFKKMCGEAASVNSAEIDHWKNTSLKNVLQRYNPADVYNLDETGLFFRLLPEKTLCFSSETCSGGTKNKARVTVLLGANMLGTDKLTPLVIGKSKNPRCFKNVKSLPVDYKANKKAWMSSVIWEQTLRSLDKKFLLEKRKVVFLVDNCTAHVEVKELKAIEVIYLPPNATSVVQPLDQGIINSFKTNYRKLLVQDWIKAIDDGRDFQPSLLDAIRYIHKSWKDVTSKTVENCFKHAGFVNSATFETSVDEEVEEDNIPLSVLFKELLNRKKCLIEEAESYVEIDRDAPTSAEPTITGIVEEIRESQNKELSDSDRENELEEEETETLPTKQDALRSIEVVRKYISSITETTQKDHDSLYGIEKLILNSTSREKQTLMYNYFTKQ